MGWQRAQKFFQISSNFSSVKFQVPPGKMLSFIHFLSYKALQYIIGKLRNCSICLFISFICPLLSKCKNISVKLYLVFESLYFCPWSGICQIRKRLYGQLPKVPETEKKLSLTALPQKLWSSKSSVSLSV